MTDKTEAQPEALRLAAWLKEGAWHQMRLGDVEAAGRELRRQHAEIQQLKAQLSARQAAPDGWRLVPESPTEEMQTACKSVVDLEQSDPDDHRYDDGRTTVNAIYAAMLSAAPPPPEQSNSAEFDGIKTPPPEREPLTDEQIDELCGEANRGFDIEREHYFKAVRDTEHAHGIWRDK